MANYTANGNWRPTIPNQTCAHCSATFTAHSHGQRFCGNECKGAARRLPRIQVPCGHCGKQFARRLNDKEQTCSKQCRYDKMRKPESFKRVCVVCGDEFLVKKSGAAGRTCSKQCLSKRFSDLKAGIKQSAKTVAKRSAALKLVRADPARNAAWNSAVSASMKLWHQDPDNAKAFAARSSERMKRRHTDPEFQARRDIRSSVTMKANWEKHRDLYLAAAHERYARDLENLTGIWSPEARRKKAIAAKWILKKANEALRAETDYNNAYAEVQARIRREMPYDATGNDADYYDYCRKLGTAVVTSPECRNIIDPFMSEAIPRFAKEWHARKMATAPAQRTG